MIYLDNAATTWPKPESVYKAVDSFLRAGGNPGRGGHSQASAAGYILYETRENLAKLLGVDDPNNIAFFLNATDAINTALFGIIEPGDTIITTAMEHNAVARPLRQLEKKGVTLKIVSCLVNGELDMQEMNEAIKEGAKAVVMSHASNVTGRIMPIEEIAQTARRHNVLMIIDAAQTAGVESINIKQAGIDLVAFSGHKDLMGPQGTAGLYVSKEVSVLPLRFGGTGSNSEADNQPDYMPDRLESGTANTPGIAGLNAGVKFVLETGQDTIRKKERFLTDELIYGLEKLPKIKLYCSKNNSTAVVSFIIEGTDSSIIAYYLDKNYGIACRAGLHCAPWAHNTIGTLKTGTIRFSPGYFNSADEIAQAVNAVSEIVKK